MGGPDSGIQGRREYVHGHVAHAALQKGVPLTGDQDTIDAYRQAVEAAYEASKRERERERREFIERRDDHRCVLRPARRRLRDVDLRGSSHLTSEIQW